MTPDNGTLAGFSLQEAIYYYIYNSRDYHVARSDRLKFKRTAQWLRELRDIRKEREKCIT